MERKRNNLRYFTSERENPSPWQPEAEIKPLSDAVTVSREYDLRKRRELEQGKKHENWSSHPPAWQRRA
jgi:hypothetical protein